MRLQTIAWLTVLLFVATFALVDIGLIALVEDARVRMLVRWLLIGGACLTISVLLSRRTIRTVLDSVRRERAARSEAEALANLAETVAAGEGIAETLSAAVAAVPRLFGTAPYKDVRCSIALPNSEGLLAVVAAAAGSPIRDFVFQPGEGFVGRAFSEGRVIRVDDMQSDPAAIRADIASKLNTTRSLMVAPLIAEQRTLGIISTSSLTPSAFGEHQEEVLIAVARQLAVALAAADARESAQREARQKAAIIEQMADAVVVCDAQRRIVECNQAAATLFDVRAEDLIGRLGAGGPKGSKWRMFGADDGLEVVRDNGPLSRATRGETVTADYRLVTQTGLERWVSTRATPLRAADGSVTGSILVLRDVAEERRSDTALRESEERYRQLVEFCPDPIVVHCDGLVVFANPATLAMAGASREDEIVGHPILEFIHPDSQEFVAERTRLSIEQNEASTLGRETLVRLDGDLVQIESTMMPITFEGRRAIQAVLRDVTERRQAEAALAHQATHDALTGLPNRVLLLDRLRQAVAAARRDGANLSLLLMDLDRFKEVNDTLGHHAGDLLLQQVGTRLHNALRQVDTIARLGGDEFAVILHGTGAEGVGTIVEALLHRLQAPFVVEGQSVAIGASIGVALWPEHGEEADVLMRRADVAMYVAKRGSTGFAIYAADQDRNSPDRLSMIGELRRAIEEGELVLHYQPKVELKTGQLAGVEALVRWAHPMRGLIGPDQFVPIAEQAGLIEPLSRWVLRAALAQAAAWQRIGLDVPVAVNLSMRNLHDEHLPEKIAEQLRAARIPSNLLVLEITESTLMVDLPRTMSILERLRAMGIRIAIDDFGTGHSSLAYLKRLPVDEVKIDRSFVKEIATDATDRIIVRSTVDLAHSLGLRVVAEGVEDALTMTLLAELGCDLVQGFHLGRPLRGHDLTHWLCEQQAQREGVRLAA
ncbi:MAG TPA: EAL domain-containing protein [Chloroflexota bacterium]|nr:EAL domain-containing protein [Chloroflexota bacterium]